jgi:hypothetical protein
MSSGLSYNQLAGIFFWFFETEALCIAQAEFKFPSSALAFWVLVLKSCITMLGFFFFFFFAALGFELRPLLDFVWNSDS